jgi:hypothetical protein
MNGSPIELIGHKKKKKNPDISLIELKIEKNEIDQGECNIIYQVNC